MKEYLNPNPKENIKLVGCRIPEPGTVRYTLIHNLNYWAAFPIDQDGFLSPTFQVPNIFSHLPHIFSTLSYYILV